MRSSKNEATTEVTAQDVRFSEDKLIVGLSDGRVLSVPIAWYPRLLHATPDERDNWSFIGKGEGIHWPDLDEDISVENLIEGQASGETQHSLKQWLNQRRNR